MDISMIMELFTASIDPAIALFCLLIGIVVKYCTPIDNKFIIPINIVLGVLFAMWMNDFVINFDITLMGACSGLFATSIYEAFVKKIFENFGQG